MTLNLKMDVAHPTSHSDSSYSFRRTVYRHNLWARPLPDLSGRFRDCSPEFYRSNISTTRRLVPWLNRELRYLLHNDKNHIFHVMSLILELLPKYFINSSEFIKVIQCYLGHKTEHFLHELYVFASTPYDMSGYERFVLYSKDSTVSTIINAVSSSESDVNVESGVVLLPSEPTERQPDPSRLLKPISQANVPQPKTTESISESDESNEEMAIGCLKPPQDRTPEMIVDLLQDSDVVVHHVMPPASPDPLSLNETENKRNTTRTAWSDSEDNERQPTPMPSLPKCPSEVLGLVPYSISPNSDSCCSLQSTDSADFIPDEPSNHTNPCETHGKKKKINRQMAENKLKHAEIPRKRTDKRAWRGSCETESRVMVKSKQLKELRSKTKSHLGKGVKKSKRSVEVAVLLPEMEQHGPSHASNASFKLPPDSPSHKSLHPYTKTANLKEIKHTENTDSSEINELIERTAIEKGETKWSKEKSPSSKKSSEWRNVPRIEAEQPSPSGYCLDSKVTTTPPPSLRPTSPITAPPQTTEWSKFSEAARPGPSWCGLAPVVSATPLPSRHSSFRPISPNTSPPRTTKWSNQSRMEAEQPGPSWYSLAPALPSTPSSSRHSSFRPASPITAPPQTTKWSNVSRMEAEQPGPSWYRLAAAVPAMPPPSRHSRFRPTSPISAPPTSMEIESTKMTELREWIDSPKRWIEDNSYSGRSVKSLNWGLWSQLPQMEPLALVVEPPSSGGIRLATPPVSPTMSGPSRRCSPRPVSLAPPAPPALHLTALTETESAERSGWWKRSKGKSFNGKGVKSSKKSTGSELPRVESTPLPPPQAQLEQPGPSGSSLVPLELTTPSPNRRPSHSPGNPPANGPHTTHHESIKSIPVINIVLNVDVCHTVSEQTTEKNESQDQQHKEKSHLGKGGNSTKGNAGNEMPLTLPDAQQQAYSGGSNGTNAGSSRPKEDASRTNPKD